jgi:hypothetical protein
MTESEWLGGDLSAQLRFAELRLSARRQRLLAVAMCRAAAPEHPDVLAALDVIEAFADDRAPAADVERARQRCREVALVSYEEARSAHNAEFLLEFGSLHGLVFPKVEAMWAASFAANTPVPLVAIAERFTYADASVPPSARAPVPERAWSDLAAPLRATVLEVGGNPFREVPFAPAWRTDTVLALARGAYARREFGALPILADALQDAGCDSDDLLNHLRDQRQVHVRGCWALDAVLGLV